MKNTNVGLLKRLTAGILSLIMVALIIPFSAVAVSPEAISDKVADPSTIHEWKHYFGSDVPNTSNAGGVWVDKSVFADASELPSGISLDDDSNFLVALSAIASNKTIVGYSNIPTDTMLVLDLSGSMANSGSVDDMVIAANSAIKELYKVNNHNRVGVVLYSGNSNFGVSNTNTATVVLPLDRYSVSASRYNFNSDFLSYSSDDKKVSVAYGVKDSDGNTVSTNNGKTAEGGTYIQNGLYKAWQEFEKVTDTKIEEGFQAGVTRMPIVVLMSDGAPTSATTSYANVGQSNVGTGGTTNTDMAFLTQLTASYVRTRIENKYGRTPLFYTLGLNVADDDSAEAVLDPVGSAKTLWESYKKLQSDTSTLSLYLPGTTGRDNPSYSYVSIYRNSLCTVEDYVDGFFTASGNEELVSNFKKIVDEIIIQSRYYPTHLQGGDPDFGGYITFEDNIGEYMEVKDIKGILLGDKLFSGAMLTGKINTSSDGLGTVDNPTNLGDEFIRSIRTRLGIDLTEARTLAGEAFDAGQLSYIDDDNFSNYIGWYADENGNYVDFWKEGMTNHPKNAVYINRSYGFLGAAEGNIKDSDMMYMTVQVHTNIVSGHQKVVWKIPAALIPMVTYSVTLKGNSVETATDIKVEIIDAEPIRLVFETGLRSDINELNIDEKMAAADARHKSDNGYYFWTNDWEANGNDDPYGDLSTTAHFVPNAENERYYYTEDSDIYIKNGNGDYVVVNYNDASDFTEETYYHTRTAFELVNAETGEAKKNTVYEKVSAKSLALKQQNEDGTWYIPRGTVYQEFEEFIINKSDNLTETLDYSNVPYVILNTASYEAAANLGNNGRLTVTPAQGIKISKSVDVVTPGTSTEFKFKITLNAPLGTALAEEYPYVLASTGEYTGETGMAKVVDGEIEVTVGNGQTLFITDLPTGTSYTVEELNTNADYRLKNVTVNGVSPQNGVAGGRVAERKLDNVAFVNTPMTRGGLVVSKAVTHPFGGDYAIPDGLEFNVEIKLEGVHTANASFETVTSAGNGSISSDASGIIRLKLGSGESVMINGIPEGTRYTVTETDIPNGFALSGESGGLVGGISSAENAHAGLVNSYTPESVNANIAVVADKILTGRDIKDTDSFEFVLRRHMQAERAAFVEVDRITLSGADLENGKLSGRFDMSGERYDAAGEYYYVITEIDAQANGNGIAGVTYDKTEMFFTVAVTDADMDGKLEIASVSPTYPVSVSGDSANGYTVSATFNNSYAPTVDATVEICITKRISSPTGAEFGLNGFSFGLYSGDVLAARSTITDASGNAVISLSFPPSLVGQTIEYTLKEIVHDDPIPGMTYSTEEQKISIEIIDNGDGTVGTVINRTATSSINTTFTNTYDPTDAVLLISGTKVLTGRVGNEGEFTFNLYETDKSFSLDGVTVKATAENAYNGSFAFPMITYDTVGSRYYVITEAKGDLGGITYDETVYTVEVNVTSDNNGALVAYATVTANGERVNDIVFTNVYTTTPATADISGTKMLSGRDLKEREFDFVLTDASGNEIETVTHNEKGEFAFTALTFENAGVYHYTVTELRGDALGVSYDNAVYNVTVTVTDNGIGTLHATVEYRKNNLTAGEIVFVNTYSASPTQAQFSGIKHINGRELNENEFAFVLTNTGTNTVIETVYNKADGSFEFAPRTYRAADVYHYTVTELNNMLGGVGYDTTVYSVIVTVTDDGNGQLQSDVQYKLGDEAVEAIAFENSYTASPVTVELAGVKTLSGRMLADGEFSFNLYEADSEYNFGDTLLETAVNTENGEFRFNAISFETAGTRYYVITEQNTDAVGVTYDETVYRVKITVTDNGLGALVATTEITTADGNSAETLVFANVYEALDVEVNIDILKTVKNLSQEEIGSDGFEFVLVYDGTTVDKVKSDADGKAQFTLGFTDNDIGKTFTYYVSETAGEMPYMTYSTAVHRFDIEIVYENGELKANVTHNGNAESENVADFENVYSGKPKTGDTSNMLPWVFMLIICGGAVVGLGNNIRKKQRDF